MKIRTKDRIESNIDAYKADNGGTISQEEKDKIAKKAVKQRDIALTAFGYIPLFGTIAAPIIMYKSNKRLKKDNLLPTPPPKRHISHNAKRFCSHFKRQA